MTKEKIRDFLWDYLNEVRTLDIEKDQFESFRYLDNHLDSFEIIQFIMAVESEFSITLTPEMTESETFRTISGVVDLISSQI